MSSKHTKQGENQMEAEIQRAIIIGEAEGKALVAVCNDDELLAEIQALNWVWKKPASAWLDDPKVVRAITKYGIIFEEFYQHSVRAALALKKDETVLCPECGGPSTMNDGSCPWDPIQRPEPCARCQNEWEDQRERGVVQDSLEAAARSGRFDCM
jgi:hypothetical protein